MAAEITIYTDGAARGNPGPGGYGVVLISGPHRKELSEGFRLTTNNRMELMAVCVALEALKYEGSIVTIYSDSKYVVDAVSKGWVFGWERKMFSGKKNPTAETFMVKTTQYFIPMEDNIDVEAEMAKLSEELNYLEGFLSSVMKKLSNERFVSSAPEKVVATERAKKADAEAKIAAIKERMEAFKK